MKRRNLGVMIMGLGLVLSLLTAYLAFFYAPIPTMSVRSADRDAIDLEGQTITVVGFIANVSGPDIDGQTRLVVGDLVDYQRWAIWTSSDQSQDWFTVTPISVNVGPLDSSGQLHPLIISVGTNVTVLGMAHPGLGTPPAELLIDARLSSDVVAVNSADVGVFSAPLSQKIFYFHMPAAWVGYVGFFVSLVCGLMYLRKRDPRYDRLAEGAAELGLVFATIAIITGPIWAKEEWGVYWRWDDLKLVATFILWVAYIGYLVLRRSIADEGKRARLSAVYGVIAFLSVPMSLLGSRLGEFLQSSHPNVIASSTGSLSFESGIAVMVGVVAFTVAFIGLLQLRYGISEIEAEVEEMKSKLGDES